MNGPGLPQMGLQSKPQTMHNNTKAAARAEFQSQFLILLKPVANSC